MVERNSINSEINVITLYMSRAIPGVRNYILLEESLILL
ncbi:hypothetical protein ES708_29245 [subsurface metagenome]